MLPLPLKVCSFEAASMCRNYDTQTGLDSQATGCYCRGDSGGRTWYQLSRVADLLSVVASYGSTGTGVLADTWPPHLRGTALGLSTIPLVGEPFVFKTTLKG